VETARRCGRRPQGEFLRIPSSTAACCPTWISWCPSGGRTSRTPWRVFPGGRRRHQRLHGRHVQVRQEALRANRVGMKMVMEAPGGIPHITRLFRQEPARGHGPLHQGREGAHRAQRSLRLLLQPALHALFHDLCPGTVSYLRFGPWHIKGKSQALSQAFVDSIEDMGAMYGSETGPAHTGRGGQGQGRGGPGRHRDTLPYGSKQR